MNFSCVRVRLPLNGELYGYDVEIPDGHQIDTKKTVITVSWYIYKNNFESTENKYSFMFYLITKRSN